MTGGAAGGGVPRGERLALVTGGSSFVGSHLVPALLAAGYRVRTTSRGPRPAGLAAEVDHRPADLTKDVLDGAVEGVDVVFHVAGASSSFSSEAEMELANGGATERLLGAVRRAGITRVLYVSTSAVYGEEEPLPQPILETVTPHPSRGYGRTKWLAEEAVARWSASGGEAIVVRPVSMYGPGNVKLVASLILDAAIERFAGGTALVVPAADIELRLVDVVDAVDAIVHVAGSDGAWGGVYNISALYPSSHELAGLVAAELGLTVEPSTSSDTWRDGAERAGIRDRMLAAGMRGDILLTPRRMHFLHRANRNNRLSIDALVAAGFTPRRTDLAAGIANTVAWYVDNGWII